MGLQIWPRQNLHCIPAATFACISATQSAHRYSNMPMRSLIFLCSTVATGSLGHRWSSPLHSFQTSLALRHAMGTSDARKPPRGGAQQGASAPTSASWGCADRRHRGVRFALVNAVQASGPTA